MPFNVGDTVDAMGDAFLKAPLVNTIAGNPIYTALITVLIIVLIILFVFRDATTDESLLVMGLRCGFWSFVTVTGVLFLHDKILAKETYMTGANEAYGGVFGPTVAGTVDIVPVTINTDFTRTATSSS